MFLEDNSHKSNSHFLLVSVSWWTIVCQLTEIRLPADVR